jgi:hypothetical protein
VEEEQVNKPDKAYHFEVHIFTGISNINMIYFFVQHQKSSLLLWPESSSPGRRRR